MACGTDDAATLNSSSDLVTGNPAPRSRLCRLDSSRQAHSASMHIAFYEGAQFPAEYRHDAFVAEHGSWNRAKRTGPKVIRIHLDSNGREVTLARQGPNTVLGEMAVFDEQPRSASAEATQETEVRVLRRDRLLAIVHEHPEVMVEFVKNLSQRLREMDALLQARAQKEQEQESNPVS